MAVIVRCHARLGRARSFCTNLKGFSYFILIGSGLSEEAFAMSQLGGVSLLLTARSLPFEFWQKKNLQCFRDEATQSYPAEGNLYVAS